LIATNPDTLTDLERAAPFYYLKRTAFGGKVKGGDFGVAQVGVTLAENPAHIALRIIPLDIVRTATTAVTASLPPSSVVRSVKHTRWTSLRTPTTAF
jgi:hypothetical protein